MKKNCVYKTLKFSRHFKFSIVSVSNNRVIARVPLFAQGEKVSRIPIADFFLKNLQLAVEPGD